VGAGAGGNVVGTLDGAKVSRNVGRSDGNDENSVDGVETCEGTGVRLERKHDSVLPLELSPSGHTSQLDPL